MSVRAAAFALALLLLGTSGKTADAAVVRAKAKAKSRAVAQAAYHPSPVQLVLDALPEKLKRIRPGMTAETVRATLGPAPSRQGASEFRELDGVRFDTTVTYHRGQVETLWHATARSKLSFRDIEPLLNETQRGEIDEELRSAGPGDENGRYLTVRWREAGVTARFLNDDRAPLAVIIVENKRK